MKVVVLLGALIVLSGVSTQAQSPADAGRPDAGPCPGFGTTGFAWDAVVSDPDTAARQKPGNRLPKLPKFMYRDGYQASAVVSFVVDAKGHVVPGTLSLLESSNEEYGRWACDAAKQLRFEPAKKSGQPVAALSAQPFAFSATVTRR